LSVWRLFSQGTLVSSVIKLVCVTLVFSGYSGFLCDKACLCDVGFLRVLWLYHRRNQSTLRKPTSHRQAWSQRKPEYPEKTNVTQTSFITEETRVPWENQRHTDKLYHILFRHVSLYKVKDTSKVISIYYITPGWYISM
jgi:hypothetical protein